MKRILTSIFGLLFLCGVAQAQPYSGFVTGTFTARVQNARVPGYLPNVKPYSGIPINNIYPFVTVGTHPLVQGGASATMVLYGIGSDNSVFDISTVAYMQPPQVVAPWTGGINLPNIHTNKDTIISFGGLSPSPTGGGCSTFQPNCAPTFTETAPAVPNWATGTVEVIGNPIVDSNGNIEEVSAVTGDAMTGSGSAPSWPTTPLYTTTSDHNVTWTLGQAASAYPPATNVQVATTVTFAAFLPNGISHQGFTFSDLFDTLAPGSSLPAATDSYDITITFPGIPINTVFERGVAQSSLVQQ